MKLVFNFLDSEFFQKNWGWVFPLFWIAVELLILISVFLLWVDGLRILGSVLGVFLTLPWIMMGGMFYTICRVTWGDETRGN